MNEVSAIVKFVSGGSTPGTSGTNPVDAVASGSAFTADPLFVVCTVLIAIVCGAASLFLYSRYKKKTRYLPIGLP